MLFVIEGVDRTGKTTLAERIAERCDDPQIIHFSAPRYDAITEYVEPLLGYEPGAGKDLIVDRHYLGESVWPTIFDRPSRMTTAERVAIESFLRVRGAVCVWAWRDPLELEDACIDEPCVGRARLAQDLFSRAVNRSLLPWWLYVHGDSIDYLLTTTRERERRVGKC